MLYTIKKCCSPRPGRLITSKIQVKAFKSSQDMHEFMNKQTDNSWSIISWPGVEKSGYYSMLGGRYVNLKNVDPSVLAHI